jgi:hypothetical protein
MNKNAKTPLGRKVENLHVESKFASFEAFEQRKSKKRRWLIIPIFLLVSALIGYIYTPNTPSNTNLVNDELKKNTNSIAETSIEDTLPYINSISTEISEPTISTKYKIVEPVNTDNKIATKSTLIVVNRDKKNVVNLNDIASQRESIETIKTEKPQLDSIKFSCTLKHRPEITANPRSLVELIDLTRIDNTIDRLNLSESIIKTPFIKDYTPSVTLSIGPHIATNKLLLGNEADKYIHPDFKKVLDNTVQSDVGISASLYYSRPIYKGLSIYGGLGFVNNKLRGSYTFSLDSVPVYDIDNTIAGFVQLADNSPLRNIDLGSSAQQFGFISIPIGLSYTFLRPKYSFEVSAGAEFAFLTGAKGNILNELNITEVNKLKDIINPTYNSFNGKIAAYRSISALLSAGVSTGYTLQSNSLYTGTQYRIKNTAFDLQATLRFNLLNK